MSVESPTSSKENKPDTLFIRCSVVVTYFFLAASVLVLILQVALIIDLEWGLLGGRVVSLPVFRNSGFHLNPFVWAVLLQLAWWVFHIFYYICGKYDQVAEKYEELEWIELPWGREISATFIFSIMPFSVWLFGSLLPSFLYILAKVCVWIWHLIF